MDSFLEALALAGFVLAHTLHVLSHPDTQDLKPVAFVARGDDQRFVTFEGDNLEDMVERGKRELANARYDAWALAYEGFVTVQGERKSAVFVHSWMRGLDSPLIIAQAWTRAGDKARAELLGQAVRLSESSAPKSAQGVRVDPMHLDEQQLRVLAAGIKQYEELGEDLRRTDK